MDDQNLKNLAERIKTTKSRYRKVINYRSKLMSYRKNEHKHIINGIIKILNHELRQKNLDYKLDGLVLDAKKLLGYTETDKKSLETLLRIIEHKGHMPTIMEYFNKLDKGSRKDFEEVINHIQKIFDIIKYHIKESLLPIIDKEIKYLNEFIDTENLTNLIEYIQFTKHERSILEKIEEAINPSLKYVHKSWKKFKKLIGTVHDFSDEHQKAFAVLLISISLLSLVLGVFPIVGVLAGITHALHKSHLVGEIIPHISHIDHAINTLINH